VKAEEVPNSACLGMVKDGERSGIAAPAKAVRIPGWRNSA